MVVENLYRSTLPNQQITLKSRKNTLTHREINYIFVFLRNLINDFPFAVLYKLYYTILTILLNNYTIPKELDVFLEFY